MSAPITAAAASFERFISGVRQDARRPTTCSQFDSMSSAGNHPARAVYEQLGLAIEHYDMMRDELK